MAKLRLLWAEVAAAGAWSAAATSEDYPPENLGHPHRAKLARTGPGASAWFKVDLGSAQAVKAFALIGHDLADGDADLYIEANSSDSWASPAFSQAVTFRAGALIEFFATAKTYQFWRFRFSPAGGATRNAGRMMLFADFYECARNPTREAIKWGQTTKTGTRQTIGGQTFADVGATLRTFKADFGAAPSAQKTAFEALGAACGIHKPFLMSFNHDAEPVAGLLYGRLTKLGGADAPLYLGTDTFFDLALEMVEEG